LFSVWSFYCTNGWSVHVYSACLHSRYEKRPPVTQVILLYIFTVHVCTQDMKKGSCLSGDLIVHVYSACLHSQYEKGLLSLRWYCCTYLQCMSTLKIWRKTPAYQLIVHVYSACLHSRSTERPPVTQFILTVHDYSAKFSLGIKKGMFYTGVYFVYIMLAQCSRNQKGYLHFLAFVILSVSVTNSALIHSLFSMGYIHLISCKQIINTNIEIRAFVLYWTHARFKIQKYWCVTDVTGTSWRHSTIRITTPIIR
jgi:hypothetical protein